MPRNIFYISANNIHTMWNYFKSLFQLLLSPSRGWEDVSASGSSFEALVRGGYIPLVVITGLTEFIQLAYVHDLTFLGALGEAVAVGGGMFASLYASRLFLDVCLKRYISDKINLYKVGNLCIYLLGLDCYYRIFANLLPASLTFLSFLPLISIIVLFKSIPYMEIEEEKAVNFLILSFTGVVAIPLIICRVLMLII